MKESSRSIFRPEVVQRYIQEREKAVLPRFISSRVFVFIWLLFSFFLLGGSLFGFKKVPVYASYPAVAIRNTSSPTISDSILFAVLLPAEKLSILKVGQPIILNANKTQIKSKIIIIEPEVIEPEAVWKRFAVHPSMPIMLTKLSVVAIAKCELKSGSLPTMSDIGNIYHGEVEVGSTRLISYVPIVGELFRAKM